MTYSLRRIILGAAMLFMVFGGVLYAQTAEDAGSGFRITPVRVDLDVDKGRTATEFLEVENVTDAAKVVIPVVDDFLPSEDESGQPQLFTGDDTDIPYSIKSFVQPIDRLTLEPGEVGTLPVTIFVPEDTTPGAYFGVVRVVEGDQEGFDGNVSFSASVGTVFLVNVPGETVELATLEQLSASTNNEDGSASLGSVFSSAPDSITVRVRNEGNTFVAPFGQVVVKNWSGDEVYRYEINDTIPRGNVLPDSVRRFTNDIENIGGFGRYTIEANVAYGEGGSLIPATASFWVIPWVTLAVILAAIVGVVYFFTRGLKRYNEMVVKRTKGSKVKR